jgi:3-oxoadipate enol-lactonase
MKSAEMEKAGSGDMSLIHINGIDINVEVQGNGYPIILVHGLHSDSTQWHDEVLCLKKHFKTIALDCRGHGKSEKPKAFTLNDHVQDILALMDTFDIDTAHLYGVSMGSYIAQGVAIAQPHKISKLILTVPKSNGLTSSTQRLLSEHAAELKGMSSKEAMNALSGHIVFNQKIRDCLADLNESTLTPEQRSAADTALNGFDFRADLHKITAETLVISGKHDGLNPPAEGRLCAALIPKAIFMEMQYSGHLPMHEEPERYREIVDSFLLSGE